MGRPESGPVPSGRLGAGEVRAWAPDGAAPPGAAVRPGLPVAGQRAARLAALCQDLIMGLLMALILVLPMASARWTRSALLVVAAGLWATRWALGGRPAWRRSPLDWPIACFGAWALLSAVASIRPLYSLEKVGQEPLSYFGLYYLVQVHVRSERDHRRIVGALGVGLAIMAGYGLWEWSRPWHLPGVYIRSLTAGGTYIGAYLAAAVPMAAAQAGLRGPIRRAWWWLVTGLGVLCVVPTLSRAAWAGVAIALLLLAVAVNRWLWVPLVVAAGVGSVLFGTTVIPRFLSLVSPAHLLADVSAMDRLPIWRYALERIGDHPWLGFGFGRRIPGGVFLEGYRSGALVVEGGPLGYAHNTFLDLGLQMGFVGLAFFLWLLGAVLVVLWRAWRAAPPGYPKAVTAGALAVALAFPVRAMTNNYFTDDPVILFWFLVALALAAGPSAAASALPGSGFVVAGSDTENAAAKADGLGTRDAEPGTSERSRA